MDATVASPSRTATRLARLDSGVSAWWGLVAAFGALLILLATAGRPDEALAISAAAAAAVLALAFGTHVREMTSPGSLQRQAIVTALAMSAAFQVGAVWVRLRDGAWPPPGWTLGALLLGAIGWFVAATSGIARGHRAVALIEALLPGSMLGFAALYAIPISPRGDFAQSRPLWVIAGVTIALGFAAATLQPASIGATAATLGSAGVLLGLLGDVTAVVVLGNSAFVAAGIAFLVFRSVQPDVNMPSTRELGRIDLLLAPALVLLVVVAILLRDAGGGASQIALRACAGAAVALLVTRQLALLWQQRQELRELDAAHRDLTLRASLDLLTELPNRAALLTRLDEEVERATRHKQSLTLCFIDIDHFKSVNDNLGHAAGDECLRAVAGILRGTARSIDYVGRYGGEEFLVAAPGTDLDEGMILGERLRAAVERADIALPNGVSLEVTISAGLAEFPKNASTVDELIARADDALYLSKRSGRNRVTSTPNESIA